MMCVLKTVAPQLELKYHKGGAKGALSITGMIKGDQCCKIDEIFLEFVQPLGECKHPQFHLLIR